MAFDIVLESESGFPEDAILALVEEALGTGWRTKSAERLREGNIPINELSLVARDDDGQLIGTVRLWPVVAGTAGDALLLGPLAIDLAWRGKGVGRALMSAACEKAKSLGWTSVLLVGDPPYYGRVGFSADKTGGLRMPGPYDVHRLLALELVEGCLDHAEGLIQKSA